MPDGQVVEMPDNPTPEQRQQLQKLLQRQAPSEWTARSLFDDAARGLGKAVMGTKDLLQTGLSAIGQSQGDLRKYGLNPATGKINYPEGAEPDFQFTNSGSRSVDEAIPAPKGQSPTRQLVRATAEGAGGAFLGPISKAGVAAGAAGGAGAEIASRLLPDSWATRLLGALVGAGGVAVAANKLAKLTPQAQALAKESLEGITPEMLEKAQKFQLEAAKNGMPGGVKVDLAQALEAVGAPASNLTTLRNFLANKSQGTEVQKTLREQPGQLSTAADLYAGGLPGKNRGAMAEANVLQDTATEAINAAKKERTVLWETTLEAARDKLRQNAQLPLDVARQNAAGVEAQLKAAADQLAKLKSAVDVAKAGDTTAIAKANEKAAEIASLIEKMRSPALPRGRAAGNTGRFLEPSARGESIDFDLIGREAQANNLQRNVLPQVTPAPSLPTLQADKALREGQQTFDTLQKQAENAAARVRQAEANALKVDLVPSATVQSVASYLVNLAGKSPNTAQSAFLGQLARKLQTNEGFVQDPAALNQILKEAAAKLKSPDLASKGIDAGTSKFLGGQIQTLRERFGETFAPLREANQSYKRFTEEVVNPLKQGPTGQIAGRRGYFDDTQASGTPFTRLMEQGVDPSASQSEIRRLGTELAKTDPEAFASSLRTYVSGKLKRAMEPGVDAATAANNPDMAQRIASSLFANEMQFRGLRDAVSVSAATMGQKPAEAVRGLDHLVQLTKALKSRPGSVGGLTNREVLELGGQNYGADALRVFGFLPFEKAARRLEDRILGDTLRQFDKVLTSPEGAKLLAELGRTPVMSKKTFTILSAYLATQATADDTVAPGDEGIPPGIAPR